jgi:glycopeptide antibiotics resistance protein
MWWTLGALLVIAAAIMCLVPFAEIPTEFELNDKISHVLGHGALALYFAGLVPRRGWWKIFVFLLFFGITIEFAQYYMHVGRNGDPRDVIANSLGAAFGLLLARCGLARWPQFASWLLGRRTAE